MSERLQVEYAALTDVGRKRTHNEDSFKVAPDEGLYLVADGMGGHNAGEVASAMAVDVVSQFFADARDEPVVSWPYKQARGERFDADTLGIAVQYANLRIYESSRESADRRGMGTTLVGALVRQGAAWVAHVGDSRGYMVRATGAIEPLTIDHSLLEEYRRTRPDLTDEQLKKFPYKNVITRAVGVAPQLNYDVVSGQLKDGDQFLLCSDGLTGHVDDAEIRDILMTHSPQAACDRLIELTLERGANDNVTAVVMRCAVKTLVVGSTSTATPDAADVWS